MSKSKFTDKALALQYKRNHAKQAKLNSKIIEMGLGHLRPSDMRKLGDNAPQPVKDLLRLMDESFELRLEAESRFGPGLMIIDQLIWKGN